MAEYQNALEEMSSEAVEYVRGIPVVKTFGQSVFSFKRFRDSIKKYEKWTVSYTKDLRIPMMGYTAAINAVFAILIAGTFLFGGVKSGTVNNTFLLNLMFYIIITPTILRLAARFWDVNKGKITVGGMDISKIDPETLMSLYSIVFQDVTLFNNTVMENIRIGKMDATDEEVIAAN